MQVKVTNAPGFENFIGKLVPGLGNVTAVDDRGNLAVVTDEIGGIYVVPSKSVTPFIEEAFDVERYRIRGSENYPGDHVENHSRWINGKLFSFNRVRWADGTTTIRVYKGRTTELLHIWES